MLVQRLPARAQAPLRCPGRDRALIHWVSMGRMWVGNLHRRPVTPLVSVKKPDTIHKNPLKDRSGLVPVAAGQSVQRQLRQPKLTSTIDRRRAAVGQKPTLTRPVLEGRIRLQAYIYVAIPGLQDATKGNKQHGLCGGGRDALASDAPGDAHRSAGVSHFWITCPSGALSGNRIINCWADPRLWDTSIHT
jgi:hypothetical protein